MKTRCIILNHDNDKILQHGCVFGNKLCDVEKSESYNKL